MIWTTVLAPLVRHGLTALGGYLLASGVVNASQVTELAGAGVTIAGVLWSIIEKRIAWLK